MKAASGFLSRALAEGGGGCFCREGKEPGSCFAASHLGWSEIVSGGFLQVEILHPGCGKNSTNLGPVRIASGN